MKSLREIDLKGKRVLMRVDFNVPLYGEGRGEPLEAGLDRVGAGKITDDTRIRAVIPTIQYILNKGGKLILMSHLGRPKGKKVESMSLKPVAERLSTLLLHAKSPILHSKRDLGKRVKFMPCCIGEENERTSKSMQAGDVMLLENTRFHAEEEKNDNEYAKKLAKLGDVFVNDAFGSSHRAHASVEAVAHYFKEKAPGFLMEKELKYLSQLVESPTKPYIAIMGGAKISTKIDVIENLLPKVDKILIGGGMVFTFFKSMGYKVGTSLVEEDKISTASALIKKGKEKIMLPVDIVIGNKFENTAEKDKVAADSIPDGWMGLDIGPKAGEIYANTIKDAKTIFWNGPTGVFEFDNFACSTKAIAKQLAEQTKKGVITVVGGGDTVAAVNKFGFSSSMSHISTGGGASLEFLSGLKLPGVEALG